MLDGESAILKPCEISENTLFISDSDFIKVKCDNTSMKRLTFDKILSLEYKELSRKLVSLASSPVPSP